MNRLVNRTTCRICGNKEMTKVFDLGTQHLQGLFVKEGSPTPPIRKIPLELLWCNTEKNEGACGLLQLSKTVPPDILYSTYWYRSGTNTTMRNHLKSITERIVVMVGDRKARVLDIGCNDGTMLSYYPENYYKVGVDPSNASDDYKGNDILFVKDIFPTSKLTGQKFDVISSIACLYDLEDPMNFVYEVQEALSADGVWVFEMSYMPSMMNMNAYDTICNEHLEYYSLAVLEYMLNSCNMKLIEVELTNTNGGSILGRAVKKNNELYPVVHEGINELRMLEFEMALDIEKPYRKFAERSYILNANLMWLLRTLQKKGKVVHLYGASTKGNTTLQLAGIDNTIIPYAAERNPDKWGAKTLGSNIEIISEEESRAMKPSAYLVLPWHFRKEFIVREADTITSGIDFIFPLPSIEIVTKDGTKTFEEYMNMLGEKGIY